MEIKNQEAHSKREKNKPNGSQSPSSEDSFKPSSSTTSLMSSDSQSPSRNNKSLTPSSPVAPWRKKSWRSSPSKNKPKPVKEPDSKPSSLSVMKSNSSDWDGNVTRKSKVPSRVPSLWPSSTLSQSERDIGETRSVQSTPSPTRLQERPVQSRLDWFPLQEVPVWLLHQSPRSCSSSLVSTTFTPRLKERQELEVTSSKLPTLPFKPLPNSTHQTYGVRAPSSITHTLPTEPSWKMPINHKKPSQSTTEEDDLYICKIFHLHSFLFSLVFIQILNNFTLHLWWYFVHV